jgi:mono/diheme cytochrome c family protein
MGYISWAFFVVAIAFSSPACEDKKEKKESAEAAPTEPEANRPADPPVNNTGDASPDQADQPSSGPKETKAYLELVAICNNDFGRIWNAKDRTCGEPMADYSCCKDQILARFGGIATEIEEQFSSTGDQKLYNCGQVDGSTTMLYWIKVSGTKYDYSFFQISGEAKPVGDLDIACEADASELSSEVKDYDGSIDGVYPIEKADAGDAEAPEEEAEDGEPEEGEPEEGDPEPDPGDAGEPKDGPTLFAENCQTCHQGDTQVKNIDVAAIKNNIENTEPMKFLGALQQLSDEDIEKISTYLGTL